MQPIDLSRAAQIGIGVLVATLVASVPMVAVYAHLINPGQPQHVYDAAARWIAPWSSHVIGPLLFFWWNYRAARKTPQRPATVFALAGLVVYLGADLASAVMFGLALSTVLTATFFVSLSAKAVGALLGARLGQVRAAGGERSAAVHE